MNQTLNATVNEKIRMLLQEDIPVPILSFYRRHDNFDFLDEYLFRRTGWYERVHNELLWKAPCVGLHDFFWLIWAILGRWKGDGILQYSNISRYLLQKG